MADTTNPLNPGQREADENFNSSGAQKRLGAQEQAAVAQKPSGSNNTLASRENQIPYKPDAATGEPPAPGKKKSKLRAWLTVAGILGIVGGGGSLYEEILRLPLNLVEQAAHTVKQRILGEGRQRVAPYLAKFFSKSIFGNTVAINNCVTSTNPAPIITQDCFYRTRKDYPDNPFGRASQAWWDGRMAKKLVEAGIDIEYVPGGGGNPDEGGKPAKWTIRISSGEEYDIDVSNADAGTETLFRSASTRGEVYEIQREIMDRFSTITRAGDIEKMRMRDYWERQFGLVGCTLYCAGKKRPLEGQGKLAGFKAHLLGVISLKVTGGRTVGLAWACMLSRDYSCRESDSEFRKQFAESIEAAKVRFGEGKVEDMIALGNEAKNSGKTLAQLMVQKVMEKIIGKTATTIIFSPIPVVGQVFAAVSVATIVYTIYSVLTSDEGQYLVTLAKDEGFIGAANILAVAADERNAVKQIYDGDAHSAYAERFKGYERSLTWQSQYGNIEGLKNYQVLFGREANAATIGPNEYPNVCNDLGDRRPDGYLVCPQWQYDYTPPVLATAQNVGLPAGQTQEILDGINSISSDILNVINTPVDATTSSIINSPVGQVVAGPIHDSLEPITTSITQQILMPPFSTVDDVRGAKLLDAAWAGMDRSYNEMIRGGLRADGTPYGWGRVLSDEEVQVANAEAEQEIQEEFARLPLWDRIMSTKYSQSFASQFAFAAPTPIQSPTQFIASLLSPMTGMRFAALHESASAAITPTSNFFHIPQYGGGTETKTAPIMDENSTAPCPNDRTPLKLGDPGAIDKGLGRAEFSTANFCAADEYLLKTFSANDSGEPLITTQADSSAISPIATGPAGTVTGTWIWPIEESDYRGDTSCYAATAGRPGPHAGIDLVGKAGDGKTKILAVDGGEVIISNPNSVSAGGFVVIKHSEGLYSMYMHMYPDIIGRGPVAKGQVIGREGHAGQASGPHLHFAVTKAPIHTFANSSNPLSRLPLTGAYKTNTSCR